jgi:EpsI family protein
MDIDVPGRGVIRVNKYIVSKGEDKSVVLYWYQSHQRVIASEYAAKVYLVADAIRYNRTDTALVRVVVPVAGDEAAAMDTAKRFVQGIFPSLGQFLPD